MKLSNFIKKRPYLVWYTKNYDGLSPESVVEATLNYGDWDDVQELINILGIKKTADIFKKKSRQKRSNYGVKTKQFFTLYFKVHARS